MAAHQELAREECILDIEIHGLRTDISPVSSRIFNGVGLPAANRARTLFARWHLFALKRDVMRSCRIQA